LGKKNQVQLKESSFFRKKPKIKPSKNHISPRIGGRIVPPIKKPLKIFFPPKNGSSPFWGKKKN